MIEILPWDSQFFGFGIGRMDLTHGIASGVEKVQHEIKERDIKLLYLFHDLSCEIDKDAKKQFVAHSGAKLVDTKLVYEKSLVMDELVSPPDGVVEFSGDRATGVLYQLALQSGIYSRFRIDLNFPPGSFEKLYCLWMDNSINRKIADNVLVAKGQETQIQGMVTLSLKGEQAVIGLLSVDESARGISLGRKLMIAAEYHALTSGKTFIAVATQRENRSACRFYEKLGYNVISRTEIYHWWV